MFILFNFILRNVSLINKRFYTSDWPRGKKAIKKEENCKYSNFRYANEQPYSL